VQFLVLRPLAARAPQGESIRQVALLIGPAASDIEAQRRIAAFRERMQGLGWVDGRNVRFEYRWGGGDADRIARHTAELVAAQPDVIMANSTPAIADPRARFIKVVGADVSQDLNI
jgi:hypothetical protein